MLNQESHTVGVSHAKATGTALLTEPSAADMHASAPPSKAGPVAHLPGQIERARDHVNTDDEPA